MAFPEITGVDWQGGYNLESTAKSAVACVRVLMGEPPEPLDPWRLYASEPTVRVVNKVLAVQSKYWKCCRPEFSTVDEASPPPERLNGSGYLVSALIDG
jgi:histone deacetylase 6